MQKSGWMAIALAVGSLLTAQADAATDRDQPQAVLTGQADLISATDDFVGRLFSTAVSGDPNNKVEQTAIDWLVRLGLESTKETRCHASEPRCLLVARRLAAEYHVTLEKLLRPALKSAVETQVRTSYNDGELAILARFLVTSAGRKTPINVVSIINSTEMRAALSKLSPRRIDLEQKYRDRLARETSIIDHK